MPEFAQDTPRASIKVLELKDLTAPRPYKVGHPLTHDEAKFMNDRVASVLANGYSGDLRREMEKIDKERLAAHKAGNYTGPMNGNGPAEATEADIGWDHQAKFDEKFAAYKVGGVNTRMAPEKDPLEKIAREIAVRETKDALLKQGHKVKNWMDAPNEEFGSEFNKLVQSRLNGKHKDRIYALAKSQVESRPEDDEDEFDIPEGLREAQEAA